MSRRRRGRHHRKQTATHFRLLGNSRIMFGAVCLWQCNQWVAFHDSLLMLSSQMSEISAGNFPHESFGEWWWRGTCGMYVKIMATNNHSRRRRRKRRKSEMFLRWHGWGDSRKIWGNENMKSIRSTARWLKWLRFFFEEKRKFRCKKCSSYSSSHRCSCYQILRQATWPGFTWMRQYCSLQPNFSIKIFIRLMKTSSWKQKSHSTERERESK